MQPLISHFTPTFQDLDWPHSPIYIIVNVSSSHTRLFYLERILQKNTWLAAILSDSGGGIFSELRDWPNSTQAKDLSVSAITIIAQFTFWLIPGASTMGEYLVYIQERSCAQLRQTQHLFTPDRLLPSFWADSTDAEGAERQKCDASRSEMRLERRQRNWLWRNKNDWPAQLKVHRCEEIREGGDKGEGVDNIFVLELEHWQQHLQSKKCFFINCVEKQ